MNMTFQARKLMLAVGERQFRHSQRHGTRPLWRLAAALAGLWFMSRAILPVDQRSAVEVLRYLQPVGWTFLLAAPLMVLVLAGPLDWWDRTVSREGWAFIWRAARFVMIVLPVSLLAAAPVVVHFLPQAASLPVVGNVALWGDVRLVLAVVLWLSVYDFTHSMLALAYTSQDPALKTEVDWSIRWVFVLVQLVFGVFGKFFGLLRRLGRGMHDLQQTHKKPPTAMVDDFFPAQDEGASPRGEVLEGQLVDADADDAEALLAAMRGGTPAYADAT